MEIEITSEGGIVARIPGQEMEGRASLFYLGSDHRMFLRGDSEKNLRPGRDKGLKEATSYHPIDMIC